MLPDLRGSSSAVIRTLSKRTHALSASFTTTGAPPKSWTRMLFVGECDFADDFDGTPLWTASALPTVITLSPVPETLLHAAILLPSKSMRAIVALGPGEHIIQQGGTRLRVQVLATGTNKYAAVLPIDQFFPHRVSAAHCIWKWLNGKRAKPIQMMPIEQRKKLMLVLRALDGRRADASYRDIADVLFGLGDAAGRAWKGHDLRDRTRRLVHRGAYLMEVGYRRLLVYPYRQTLLYPRP